MSELRCDQRLLVMRSHCLAMGPAPAAALAVAAWGDERATGT
jgi:hypothetical protein